MGSTKGALYSGINKVAEHAMFLGKKTWRGNNIYSRLQVLWCLIMQQLAIIAYHQHKSLYVKSPDPLSLEIEGCGLRD